MIEERVSHRTAPKPARDPSSTTPYLHPTRAAFAPAWWCRNAHLQTLWPYLFRRRPRVPLRRERLELPDGDFLDLDWAVCDAAPGESNTPIVLVLHGLEGSSESKYALG